jgi:hypothetical protein
VAAVAPPTVVVRTKGRCERRAVIESSECPVEASRAIFEKDGEIVRVDVTFPG